MKFKFIHKISVIHEAFLYFLTCSEGRVKLLRGPDPPRGLFIPATDIGLSGMNEFITYIIHKHEYEVWFCRSIHVLFASDHDQSTNNHPN